MVGAETASPDAAGAPWLKKGMRLPFFGEVWFAPLRVVRFRRSGGRNRGPHGSACTAPSSVFAEVGDGNIISQLKHRGIDGRGGCEASSYCPQARRRVHAAKARRSPGTLSRSRGCRDACAGDGIGVRPFASASDSEVLGRRATWRYSRRSTPTLSQVSTVLPELRPTDGAERSDRENAPDAPRRDPA